MAILEGGGGLPLNPLQWEELSLALAGVGSAWGFSPAEAGKIADFFICPQSWHCWRGRQACGGRALAQPSLTLPHEARAAQRPWEPLGLGASFLLYKLSFTDKSEIKMLEVPVASSL